MPKKKTGQRRKAEKQKLRQKEIRTAKGVLDLAKVPANSVMASIISLIDPEHDATPSPNLISNFS